jgi:hypothetical protein
MKKIFFLLINLQLIVISSITAWAFDASEIQIGGYLSQGYLQTDNNNYLANTKKGSFEFNEMGINFQTHPAEKTMVGLQLSARDLGEVGNDQIGISWAFGEYTWREWLGVRAGIIKVPFGLYNETRDYDMLRTSIFLPSSIYNEWLRDAFDNMKGIQFFGNVSLGKGGLLKYQIQGGENPTPTDSGTALYIKNASSSVATVDRLEGDKSYNGNLIWVTPLDGLRLGYNYFYSVESKQYFTLVNGLNAIASADDIQVNIFSIEYIYNNLQLSAEYLTQELKSKTSIPALGIDPPSSKLESGDRYYLKGAYRFTDWFETGLYYSMFESDKSVNSDTNELKDICLSLRFDINESWIAKAEAHKMTGLYGVFPEDDGTLDKDWMLYAAKLSYYF